MTSEPVVFDAWAWIEVLQGTKTGSRLAGRYLAEGPVHTVDVTLAEVALRMARDGTQAEIAVALDTIAESTRLSRGSILPIESDDALGAASLRKELRKAKRDASLVDAVVLSVARSRGLKLVSADKAYAGQPDVVAE